MSRRMPRSPRSSRIAAMSTCSPVLVTFSGYSGSPRATRAARRSGPLTSSRGLSRRRVVAPIMMASLSALIWSTSSKSASLDRISRSPVVSSMQPSTDMATDSRTYGRLVIGLSSLCGDDVGQGVAEPGDIRQALPACQGGADVAQFSGDPAGLRVPGSVEGPHPGGSCLGEVGRIGGVAHVPGELALADDHVGGQLPVAGHVRPLQGPVKPVLGGLKAPGVLVQPPGELS